MSVARPNATGFYDWNGRTFHGQQAVADAAGVSRSVVGWHLEKHGHLDLLGKGRGRHGSHKSNKSRPLLVGPHGFPSVSAFERAAGLGKGVAARWLRMGRHDRLLAALMASDARHTAAALKDADMIDRIGRAA